MGRRWILLAVPLLFVTPATAGPRLLCVGDSITAGAIVGQDASFCTLVAERLGAGPLNLAIGGTTSRWWATLESPEIPRADLTLLLLGTNDAFLPHAGQHSVTPQEYLGNLLSIIDRIRGKVVLLTPPKAAFGHETLPAYGQAAIRLARLKPRKIAIVDLWPLLSFEDGDYMDWGHPSEQGHVKIKRAVMRKIRARRWRRR